MPCYDERNDPQYQRKEGIREGEALAKLENKRLSNRLHEVTALLCEAGRARADRRVPSLKVRKWWKEHSAIDAKNGKPWANKAR